MPSQERKNPVIVLVHAAWFDGSSWNKVTAELLRHGHKVVATQIPLNSFHDDVAAVRRVLAKQEGPVLVAGHSYGGAVITAAAAGNPNVKGLVYVAAIVPDEGETVGAVFSRTVPHPAAPVLQPDSEGLLWLSADDFRNAVAPDATAEEIGLLDAAQKPIAVKCLGEPMTTPAWKEKPSWFLIAENDRMVSPDTQHFLAQRMKSKIVSVASDHAPLITRAHAVAELLEEAVRTGESI